MPQPHPWYCCEDYKWSSIYFITREYIFDNLGILIYNNTSATPTTTDPRSRQRFHSKCRLSPVFGSK
jgi:hypothetical protein